MLTSFVRDISLHKMGICEGYPLEGSRSPLNCSRVGASLCYGNCIIYISPNKLKNLQEKLESGESEVKRLSVKTIDEIYHENESLRHRL